MAEAAKKPAYDKRNLDQLIVDVVRSAFNLGIVAERIIAAKYWAVDPVTGLNNDERAPASEDALRISFTIEDREAAAEIFDEDRLNLVLRDLQEDLTSLLFQVTDEHELCHYRLENMGERIITMAKAEYLADESRGKEAFENLGNLATAVGEIGMWACHASYYREHGKYFYEVTGKGDGSDELSAVAR